MRPFQRAEPVQREDAGRRRARRDDFRFVGRQADARIDQHPHVNAYDHGYTAQVQVHEVNALHGQQLDGIVHDFYQANGEHEDYQHQAVERTEGHPKVVAAMKKKNVVRPKSSSTDIYQ